MTKGSQRKLRPVYRFPAPPEAFWELMAAPGGRTLEPSTLPEPLLTCSGIPSGYTVYAVGGSTWIAKHWRDVVGAIKNDRPYMSIELASHVGG
jgi:hypothetical protein